MDYFIIFHDHSVMVVDATIGGPLVAKKIIPDFVVDGALYKGSSVAMILPQEQYFKQYPEKRPDTRKTVEYEAPVERTPEQIDNMRNGLARGLWEEIEAKEERGEPTANARRIYTDWLHKKANKFSDLVKSL